MHEVEHQIVEMIDKPQRVHDVQGTATGEIMPSDKIGTGGRRMLLEIAGRVLNAAMAAAAEMAAGGVGGDGFGIEDWEGVQDQ